jgi:hypothetical protein
MGMWIDRLARRRKHFASNLQHGLVLASHDHGFRRFAGVRVVDPLAGERP